MTRRLIVSVLLHDASTDPVAGKAVEVLLGLAEAGLADPLWAVDVGDALESGEFRYADTGGIETRAGLLAGIAAAGHVELVQVISLVTDAGTGAEALQQLKAVATGTVEALRQHQPIGSRVLDARVMAPLSLLEPSAIVSLTSAHADANLVLVPDDRASDGHFGSPISLERPEDYAAHVAGEVANHAGLWMGMDESAIERGSAGVTGHGDAKVVIARSYGRILLGPPVPVADAVGSLAQHPVPAGLEPARDPEHDVRRVAREVVAQVPGLSFRPRPSYESPAEELTIGPAARRILGETGRYLRSIPFQLRSGVFADLEHLSAEALSAATGEDATIRVIWAGSQKDRPDATVNAVVAGIDDELDRLEEVSDASSLGGEVWRGVIATSLGVADGGPFAGGVERPTNHGRSAVVTSLSLLAPPVGEDPRAVTTALDGYRVAPSPGKRRRPDADDADDGSTHDEAGPPGGRSEAPSLEVPEDRTPLLLGELAGRTRREVDHAAESLRLRRAALRDAKERFANRRDSDLGVLAWVMGILIAALATVVLITTGLAEAVGVATWSADLRTGAAVVLAATCLLIAAVTSLGAFKDHPQRMQVLPAGIVAFAVVTAIAWLAWGGGRLGWPPPFDSLRATELIVFLGVFGVLVLVAASAARLRTPAGDAAARIAGAMALIYVVANAVAGTVRPGGWYERVDGGTRLRGGLIAIGLLVAAVVATLMWISSRRIHERLRLNDEAGRLRWEASAALDVGAQLASLRAAHAQMLGTTVTLARVMRKPFGEVRTTGDHRDRHPDRLCIANKVRIERFDLDERATDTLVARIRHQLGSAGWLQQQYETAVQAFLPELVNMHGLDPDEVFRIRPEGDPFADAPDGTSGRLPPGARWDFVRLLYEGRLDDALQEPLAKLATDELLSGYIDRPGGRIDGAPSSIREFAAPLAVGTPPPLPAQLFERQDLPVAGDARAHLRSTLWWPREAIELPERADEIEVATSRIHDAGERGTVISFVRTDWSVPMAASLLPMAIREVAVPSAFVDDGPSMM